MAAEKSEWPMRELWLEQAHTGKAGEQFVPYHCGHGVAAATAKTAYMHLDSQKQ